MCGIVAMFSQHGSVTTESLQKATVSLRHRGPDGQRYWIAPDCRAGLGHAGLSITDLPTGDQPIANEDAMLPILVYGEFNGYESMHTTPKQAGNPPRTRSH